MNDKVWKVGYNWILVTSLTMTGVANATCTPKPDCATIGYTETSCETDYLACPFDNTKLKCMPCDSTYRYICSGNNISKGVGNTCNSKYVSCECIEGAIFENGSCVCDTSCSLGNIYYSDGSCSSCIDSAKTAVGIVIKDNELIVSLMPMYLKWAPEYVDVTSVVNIQDNAEALVDYNGEENTKLIAEFYGSQGDITTMAAVYCYNYIPTDMEGTIHKWYLPALGELKDYIYASYDIIRAVGNRLGVSYPISWYWSSTEHSNGSGWRINISDGSSSIYYKVSGHYVTCVLEI